MTTVTERNAKALTDRNGSTVPATPAKVVAPSNKAVASGKDTVAKGNEAPKVAKVTPTPVKCHCGCGADANLGRIYRPGHDARHAAAVAKAVVAGSNGAQAAMEALPPKLREKAERFVSNRARESARKEAAAKIRAAAKVALEAELAAL